MPSKEQAGAAKPPAKKRLPPNAGKGRVKGVPNKITSDLKKMILGALSDAGGQQYLAQQAVSNPNAFMGLVGKVLPMTVQGDKDNPLAFNVRVSFE